MSDTPAPGEPLDLTRGHELYGPSLHREGADPAAAEKLFYATAHLLGNKTITVPAAPADAKLITSTDSRRKFLMIRNMSTTAVLYIGDSDQVTAAAGPNAGWPVEPGEGFAVDGRDYDGDLYGVSDGAAIEVRLLPPSAAV